MKCTRERINKNPLDGFARGDSTDYDLEMIFTELFDIDDASRWFRL
jgi:hypothetical protein